jgi:hypothetical protein
MAQDDAGGSMLQAQSLWIESLQKIGRSHHAIVPAGTSFPAVLREPCDFVCSLRGNLHDPHAVQNDRELARDSNLSLRLAKRNGLRKSPKTCARPRADSGSNSMNASTEGDLDTAFKIIVQKRAGCPRNM